LTITEYLFLLSFLLFEKTNLDTNGTGSDVPDETGLAVVELVGHTLVDGTITDDIDDITEVEVGEVALSGEETVLTELLGEEVTSTSAITVARHVCL